MLLEQIWSRQAINSDSERNKKDTITSLQLTNLFLQRDRSRTHSYSTQSTLCHCRLLVVGHIVVRLLSLPFFLCHVCRPRPIILLVYGRTVITWMKAGFVFVVALKDWLGGTARGYQIG